MPFFQDKDNDFTGPGWKRVWEDTFSRDGLPDPRKWGYEYGKIRNNELQFYTRRAENARIEKGNLVIEGRRETFEKSEYTAASLTTQGKAGWKYGRFVMRAKLPKARGTWPAFWMLGEDIGNVGWPRCGEIDIMEHVAHDPGVIHGTAHMPDAKGEHIGSGGDIKIPDCSDAFHIYAVEWLPDRLDFFVDDKKYFTYAKEGRDGPNPWAFDKKFYLILNLAIGGDWGGQKGVDAAAFPQEYLVDYVRVYQAK